MAISEFDQIPAAFPVRSPMQNALGIIAGTALLATGLAFAFTVAVTVLTVGAIGSAVVLWKTRAVRRELREQIEAAYRAASTEGGNVVEGEVLRQER